MRLDKGKLEKVEEVASKLMRQANDTIIINMRFMDIAIARLRPWSQVGYGGIAIKNDAFIYDPVFLMECYLKDPHLITRMYLHSLMHMIFAHGFEADRMQEEWWNVACDIAVENTIMNLDVGDFELNDDEVRRAALLGLCKNLNFLSAERIYRHFKIYGLSDKDYERYKSLFTMDIHSFYDSKSENYEISREQWKKISERIKTDIKTFSKNSGKSESLIRSLEEATEEKQDYKRLLERFTVLSEQIQLNDDEFDQVYYCYGLTHYNNMPFIEPLEFKDTKRVRDFAIVLDTSASCKGATLKAFLRKTYDILKNSENFFSKINVHILQCDSEVRSDVKITCEEDFDEFIARGKLYGFGGTDYRPVFEYVDELIERREFESFKGLIYFTDGYGIYPNKAPDYDTMFVFLKEDERKPEVPWWAIRVVLTEEEITDEYKTGQTIN